MSRFICSVFGLLLIAFVALQGCEQKRRAKNFNSNSQTQVDDDSYRFVQSAVLGSQTEIEASIATKNSSKNPKVLAFADMIIKDHKALLDKLREVQDDKMVSHMDTMSTERQQQVLALSKQPAGFDKAYAQMMVEEHEKAVQLFSEASHSRIKSVSDLAEKTVPKLKAHLDSAKALQASLK
ncbi:DUF4142 domain-containing protein [Mucilaginibacter limnophilus]|uniref:DUF4142 domain-containing protein n=1 Tax=Mucilaginibacter limnophilus TaxID=1932778 RepID=A0A3S3TH00_9SPHI|nr:DUF4142 domain-containing protein [Mucilaginibacter limnophilus]RVU00816.1 DUF4142 domain-containing protein [Mucilaginibacter limnophilus]